MGGDPLGVAGQTESMADDSGTRSLFDTTRLGPVTLRNRFIKAATFEGRSPDGLVTDDLIEFHRAVAAGGAAMTTLAYLVGVTRGSHPRRVDPPAP